MRQGQIIGWERHPVLQFPATFTAPDDDKPVTVIDIVTVPVWLVTDCEDRRDR